MGPWGTDIPWLLSSDCHSGHTIREDGSGKVGVVPVCRQRLLQSPRPPPPGALVAACHLRLQCGDTQDLRRSVANRQTPGKKLPSLQGRFCFLSDL